MSSDVIARLETLLNRVVARRALPRVAAPVEVPVLATSPAPKAIAPEPLKAEAPRLDALRPEAPKPPVAEAPKPAVVEAPKPVAEAPKPVAEAPKPAVAEAPKPVAEAPKPAVVEAPKPVAEAPKPAVVEAPAPVAEAAKSTLLEVLPSVAASMDSTQVSRRVLEAPTAAPKTSLPAASPSQQADDRIAASFAAGAVVSPGFGDDEADHVETVAFRVGRALPKVNQVPAPPLPITTATPSVAREESSERRSERFAPSMPVAPVAAQFTDAAPKPASTSFRSLLQRSVALRPRG
ncbi:MAG: hypothetical protein EPO40_00160 [Myxococcaceae bacterium]|nr:MAG: hypothetical protein EPO40_00160 [Myxococcaceae bacterium]